MQSISSNLQADTVGRLFCAFEGSPATLPDETCEPLNIRNALPRPKASISRATSCEDSTPGAGKAGPSPSTTTRHMYEAACKLLSQPVTQSQTLQDLALDMVRKGIASTGPQREALATVLRPWSSVLASLGGEDSAKLAPWTLSLLLQDLFPDLKDAQGDRLAPLIKAYANDLSLAQWVTALSLPRHEQRGDIKLRELKDDSQWQSLEAELRAAMPDTEPADTTSLTRVAKGMAHLGVGALIAHVAPTLAIPAGAATMATYVGSMAGALYAQQGASEESFQHSAMPQMPSALAAQATALTATLLPAWSPVNRRALIELWLSDPKRWTLLEAAGQAHHHFETEGGSIKDALAAVTPDRPGPRGDQWSPTAPLIETIAVSLIWFFSAHEPLTYANKAMKMARQAGLEGNYGEPASTLPCAPSSLAEPHISARSALEELAEKHERQTHQERLQKLIDQPRERVPGQSPGESSQDRYHHKVHRSYLKLRQAQFTHDPDQRDERVATAREGLDKLVTRDGHAAKVAKGDIAGAVKDNVTAAQEQRERRSIQRVPETVMPSQTAPPAKSPATSSFFPGWLSYLLPTALACRQIGNTANAGSLELASTGVQLLRSSAEKVATATTVSIGLTRQVRPSGVQPRSISQAIFKSAAKLAAHATFVLGGNALGNYFSKGPAQVPDGTTSLLEPKIKSDEYVIEVMDSTIVALPDGSWASAWDVLTAPESHRAKRSVSTASGGLSVSPDHATRSAATAALERQGIHGANLDVVTHRRAAEQAQAKHQMEMALIKQLSTTEGYAWLNQLTEAEQRLWFAEQQKTVRAEKILKERHVTPEALLEKGLRQAKWKGPWQDIQVKVAGSTVDGKPVDDDKLPLLPYCLYRQPGSHPVRFLRGNVELTPGQSQILNSFLSSNACKDLASTINAPISEDEDLISGLVAKFKQDALKAKADGTLTGGSQSRLRGADIVLGFLNNSAHVEASSLYFNGLEDIKVAAPHTQASKTFQVSNYLVLRSKQTDLDEERRGQIVLYRSDSQSFTTFSNEESFRQFITERSLTQELSASWTFKNDVIRSAPTEFRDTLRKCFFDDRFLGRPTGWLQQTHITLDFKAFTHAGSMIGNWVRNHLASRQQQAQQQFDTEQQHWTPLGVRVQQAIEELKEAHRQLKTEQEHAQPEVSSMLNELARRLWAPEGQAEPMPDLLSEKHRLDLRIGNRKYDLTYWATEGWQSHGPKDIPGIVTFPSQDTLDAMEITVYRMGADGSEVVDKKRTQWLNRVEFRRNLCYSMNDLVNSNRLGRAYTGYVKSFMASPEASRFVNATNKAIVWRLRGLIEAGAVPGGVLDAEAYQNLLAEHAKIEEMSTDVSGTAPGSPWFNGLYPAAPALLEAVDKKVSTLKSVSLDGFPIEALWAMSAGGRDYIFMLDDSGHDTLMEKTTFEQFLKDDRHHAEKFIMKRAAHRYHAGLAEAFGKTQTSGGIVVTFQPTEGPGSAARSFINTLLDNTDEHSVTTSESLKFFGGLFLTGLCITGTGGIATAGCTLGTILFIIKSITNAVDALDRGDRDEAVAELLGAGFDAADVLDIAKIGVTLFKLGVRSFNSVEEAATGMRQLARQASAFDEQGVLGNGFVQPLHASPQAQTGVDGNPEWVLDGKTYVSPSEGHYVEAPLDEYGIRRAKDPLDEHGVPRTTQSLSKENVGAPIAFQNGQWRRLDKAPDLSERFVTQAHEKIPESKWAASTDLDYTRAVEGALYVGQLGATGQRAIVHAGRKALMDGIAANGQVEKLEGTPALLAVWAATPAINSGMRVDILPQSTTGTPHIKLGKGPGALISVTPDDVARLTIDDLIEQAGRAPLIAGLGLSNDATRTELKAAVIQSLQNTISSRKSDMLNHWEGIENALRRARGDINVVRKYYPGLTVDEAEELLHADRNFSTKVQRGDSLGRSMANVAGRRHQRITRSHILEGKVSNLDEVNSLAVLLQDAVPGLRTSTTGNGLHIDLEIERVALSGSAEHAGTIRFNGQGQVTFLKDGAWAEATRWNEAVDDILSDSEHLALDGRGARDAVEKAMTRRPLGEICPLLSRAKRSDCELAGATSGLSRVSLVPQEQVVRDVLHPMATILRDATNKKLDQDVRRCTQKFTEAFLTKYPEKAQEITNLNPAQYKQLLTNLKWGSDQVFWRKNKELNALGAAFNKEERLEKANFVTADVKLQYNGHDISFSGKYSSNTATDELALGFERADRPMRVIVKATKKPGVGEPSPSPTALYPNAFKASEFYVQDVDRERLMDNSYLFGTDAWQQGAGWQGNTPKFSTPLKMTSQLRQKLKGESYVQSSLDQVNDGDYFYEATVRSCSESSFLNHLWKNLEKADPKTFARGTAPKDFSGLTGTIALFTESKPCSEVCTRRLKEMMREMSGVDITVGYAFEGIGKAISSRKRGDLTTSLKFFEAESVAEVTIGAS